MSTSETAAVYQPGVPLEDLELIIKKTPRNVWDALREQRVFISGGTGFVGCWLLESLLWANQQLSLNLSITVLSRNPDAFIEKAPHLALHPIVKLVKGDVNNLEHISEPFDIVIHAATDVVKPESDSLAVYTSIVNGTQQTLELAKRSQATRYLLTSSGAVYGRQPASLTHIPETFSGAPETTALNSAYGQAKRISEWLSHYYAQQYGINVQVARCFALIGPYLPLDAQFAVGNFIKDGLDNKNIAISGDGTAVRSYLYAADMSVWLLTMLINGQQGQQYNLGSDHGISIKELADTVSHIIYDENKVTLAKQPSEHSVIQQYVPDVHKAKNELALEQYTDLHSSIIKTINWEIHRRELAQSHSGL